MQETAAQYGGRFVSDSSGFESSGRQSRLGLFQRSSSIQRSLVMVTPLGPCQHAIHILSPTYHVTPKWAMVILDDTDNNNNKKNSKKIKIALNLIPLLSVSCSQSDLTYVPCQLSLYFDAATNASPKSGNVLILINLTNS